METLDPSIAVPAVGTDTDPELTTALQLRVNELEQRLCNLEALRRAPAVLKEASAEDRTAPNIDQIAKLQAQADQLDKRLRSLESPNNEPTLAENDAYGDGVRARFVTMTEQEAGNYETSTGKPPWNEETGESITKSETKFEMEFKTYFNKNGQRQRAEIHIHSEALIKLMRTTMESHLTHEESYRGWTQKTVQTSPTALVILHCWDKLSAAALPPEDELEDSVLKSARKQLGYLLRFIKDTEADAMQALEDINIAKQVTMDYIAILFPPGTEILCKPFFNEEQIFIVDSVDWNAVDPPVTCWTLDWNGSELIKQMHEFKIPSFKGHKQIKELALYPLRFYKDGIEDVEALRKKLITRGKKFKSLCITSTPIRSILRSRGPLRSVSQLNQLRQPFISQLIRERKETHKPKKEAFRVIIDASMYEKYAYGENWLGSDVPLETRPCDCSLCDPSGFLEHWRKLFNTPEEKVDNYGTMGKDLYESFFALLPPRTLGYSLDLKKWVQIPVGSMEQDEPQNYEEKWKSLSLSEKHKTTLREMVRAHLEEPNLGVSKDQIRRVRDPVEGKGDGLVILLHGIPGVGKTLTAEALAMVLRCPLLRIDASDLNYDSPSQVDDTLTIYFEMASSWGSILLLDEADVFLQARVRSEVKQNALVSVLLRSLEYFQGILIMTTNRIMTVDVAVQSRIHYAVRYDYLDSEGIKKVWSYFENQLDESNSTASHKHKIQVWFKDYASESLTNSHFNGRDIRNLFFSAQLLSLAKEEKKLTLQDIKDVYRLTTEFRRDMQETRMKAEAQGSVIRDP